MSEVTETGRGKLVVEEVSCCCNGRVQEDETAAGCK